ncbi:MAG: ATP-binding protein [Bacteroidetes bacterium]|nr:ATP-binding protein [Bacteroidota bacterium]
MQLGIKTKLSLGLVFLFIVIILIGVVGLYSINKLANESRGILKANYESLQFAKNMLQALDQYEMKDTLALKTFEENLHAQEKNITEAGEKELTQEIRTRFEELKKITNNTSFINTIRAAVNRMTDLNMNAIVRKNNDAQATADKAKIYLAIIGTICFLISFSFIINFPGYIANPVRQLTRGIKQIADKNYAQRIHLDKGDEFGDLAEAFNSMAQRLDEYENSNLAKIIFEKKRIDTIINNMKDPIIGLDEKNHVLFINTAAIKVLGINETDILGKYAPDVAMKNDLLRNLINQENSIAPLKIFADNKESYFSKESLQILADEQPIGEVIILKNITRFKELDLAKTNFIATISHELKTPISSIMMSLKLLEDKRVGNMTEEQQKLIDHIKDDSSRLLKITGELLDLAQVETGNIQLQKQPVDPRTIVDYAYHALQVQADQKQIHIDMKMEDHLPDVTCDLEKTAWVMVNFLSNAIRYTPEKSKIIVEVKKENTAEGDAIIFSVKDSGNGIASKYKDKVFEKFYRVPGTETGKTGTGLGLAISKDFITAQGGKIWMESELNAGSTFFFRLPV